MNCLFETNVIQIKMINKILDKNPEYIVSWFMLSILLT